MHKHQNVKGKNETLQVPRCTVAFTTFLHQTPCGFAWCLFPPGERESLPCRLIRHKDSPRGWWINLPLAKTEPTGREQVQNTIVIGFLEMLPDVLARSPQTQWSARGMARSHEQWLRRSAGTRGRSLDSLLSNVNWNFRHSGHGCRLQSCDWAASTVKDAFSRAWFGARLRLGASSA